MEQMSRDVKAYFHEIVLPKIAAEHPDLSAEIGIIVLGSVGLGIEDDLSDLEAAVYLDDALWRQRGKQLQLTLNRCLQETCPYKMEGSVLCVWPLSWLLAGTAQAFLSGSDALPWEDVTIEELFTLQNNLIVWDSQNRLRGLRAATAPQQMPASLWKKRLTLSLMKLIWEDFGELRSCAKRERIAEVHILFGRVLESLFHTAFLISRRYYPWRTHLRWAFEQLPSPASDVLPHIDTALVSPNWDTKIAALERVVSIYRGYISDANILPEIDILDPDLGEQLEWAERLKAWENPNWTDWIRRCKEEAVNAGYPDHEFWVWSLWGQPGQQTNQNINHDKR